MLAELDQSEILARFAHTPAADIVRPVRTRSVFVRARSEIGCQFVLRRRRSPYKAKGERSHNIGEARSHEIYAGLAGQDQTRHGRPGYTQKTKRRRGRRQPDVLSPPPQ